jgi:hypothetical protein
MGSRSRGLLVHAELLLNTLGSGPTSVVQAAQDGPRQHPATGSDAAGQGTLQPEAAMWSVAIAGHSAVSGKRDAAARHPPAWDSYQAWNPAAWGVMLGVRGRLSRSDMRCVPEASGIHCA